MATSSASLDSSPRKNWVENSGGLPPGVRKVARALRREHPEWPLSRCIATALSRSKAWAAKGSAKGARNVADWEATRARNAARTATTAIAIHEHAVVELSARRGREVCMSNNRPPFGGKSGPPSGPPGKPPGGGPDPNQMDDAQLDAAIARAKSAAESQTGESAQRMAQIVIRLEAIKNRRKASKGDDAGSSTSGPPSSRTATTAQPRGRALELSQPAPAPTGLRARADLAVAQLGLADLGS